MEASRRGDLPVRFYTRLLYSISKFKLWSRLRPVLLLFLPFFEVSFPFRFSPVPVRLYSPIESDVCCATFDIFVEKKSSVRVSFHVNYLYSDCERLVCACDCINIARHVKI